MPSYHSLITIAVMAADPYWRQWMWFCLRNGLWYGEEGVTRSTFEGLKHLPISHTLSEEEKSNECVVISRLEAILAHPS